MNKRLWASHYEYESDLRTNEHCLGSSENKAWKKFRRVRDLSPWPLRYRSSACSSGVHYYEDRSYSRLYPQFKYMTFIYSQTFKPLIGRNRLLHHAFCSAAVWRNIFSWSVRTASYSVSEITLPGFKKKSSVHS